MTRRFASGLVVGKFAPLHRGHELVIRRALEECERVFVLSWCRPELAGCGPERRARWLERLFPQTERLVLTQTALDALAPPPAFAELPESDAEPELLRRFSAFVCEAHWGVKPEAVFGSEPYVEPFARALGEIFATPVAAVSVDPERRAVPMSGARLRENVHAAREFLAPDVYRDFVRRVAVLGGESSGKSTLSHALAEALETAHVAEYGRELWEHKGGALELADLLEIAEQQVAREEAALGHANGWLICDTSPLTTLFYSLHLFAHADPRLERLAEREYDAIVLCEPDFPFVQDGTREGVALRHAQHAWYERELERRGWSFTRACGKPAERVRQIASMLATQAV